MKIEAMKNNTNCKHTTLMTLSDDGFLDSDPTGPQEFTDEELQPLNERCRHHWTKQVPAEYKKHRLVLDQHYPYLSSRDIDSAFLSHMSIDDVYDHVKRLATGNFNAGLAGRMDDTSDDGNEPDEDDAPVFSVQEEHVVSLSSLFPSLSDAEIRHALTQARGDIDLAADLLLRN